MFSPYVYLQGWQTADVTVARIYGNRPQITIPAKQIGDVYHILDIFHVSRLYQCSSHVSLPRSQPRDNRTYTLTIFRDFKISNVKNPSATGEAEFM